LIKELLQQEVQEFIRAHENDDPAVLMLQTKRFPTLPMREIVEQIKSRQKAKEKIPIWYATNNILFPPSLSLEQSSSEATAIYKQQLIQGNKMADLTGGMGIDTYFLSQSFMTSQYVEKQEHLANLAAHNYSVLRSSNIQVHHKSADQFLKLCDSDFDLLYIDPARRDLNDKKVFRLSDCEPDMVEMLPVVLAKTAKVLIKSSPLLDIKGAIRDLGGVSEIHVVALKGEVKELLFLIDSSSISNDPTIHCVNILKETVSRFKFSFSNEEGLNRAYGVPKKYVYEPNASILKGGAFKSIAEKFDLVKLHPNTHLYTSNEVKMDFPGRIFKNLKSITLSKKTLKRNLKTLQANITVRNYPLTVDQIRKKSGLKEGGENYIFGFTDLESPKLILTEKIK
jgi:PG_1098 ferredoxin-like domain/THUMP domain-like